MGINGILGDFFVEQRSVCGKQALVLVFIAVGGQEIGAIGRAIDGDFAFGATANGADFFALGGAKAGLFTFFANRTGHRISSARQGNSAGYAALP
jgi:hypothetical protein